jgi:hypothetical protein
VYRDSTVTIPAPYLASIETTDVTSQPTINVSADLSELSPRDSAAVVTALKMNGQPTNFANAVQIDFKKDEFGRSRSRFMNMSIDDLYTVSDPSVAAAFEVANDFLARLRSISRGIHIAQLTPDNTLWRLIYLNDDETPIAADREQIRSFTANQVRISTVGVDSAIWESAKSLSENFEPPVWDTLLLDAEKLAPHVGPAIVLANTALEAFIAVSLNVLANQAVHPVLWLWINDRKDFRKEPSVAEQFDILLKVCSGKSLKEESALWEAFKNLRDIRNSFVHEGKALLGGAPVTVGKVKELIERAKAIVAWVENLLPEQHRRPESPGPYTFEFLMSVKAPHLSDGRRAI